MSLPQTESVAGVAAARPIVARASRRRWSVAPGSYAVHGLLVLFFLFPLLFMFVSAFKGDEVQLLKDMGSWRAFLPYGELSLGNFAAAFANAGFGHAFVNSLIVVGITVLLGLLVNSMTAYALARFRFRGRNLLLSLVVALVIIPFEAIAVPLLLLVNKLPWFDGAVGWMDSYHVQIIPFIANAFSIYLFYQFFISLPKDLEEAALMDGAGRWRIYWSIVLPLSKPVIATVAVLQFLSLWGNLLWPVMVVRGDEFAPLPLAMQTFFGQFPRHWGEVMAFAAMATAPTLALFLGFQRWFVKSAISSAIKG